MVRSLELFIIHASSWYYQKFLSKEESRTLFCGVMIHGIKYIEFQSCYELKLLLFLFYYIGAMTKSLLVCTLN